MNQTELKYIIEAALMVAIRPLNLSRIQALFAQEEKAPDLTAIRAAIDDLRQEYQLRGIELKEVASGIRLQVKPEYSQWMHRLLDEKQPRYSRALLETLAIIAYRQPITRAEIEEIRGVSTSSSIFKALQEREWIKTVGYRDVPGRPALLATTKQFLDYFNLQRLADLPPLAEIKDLDAVAADLFGDVAVQDADLAQADAARKAAVATAAADHQADTGADQVEAETKAASFSN